MKKDDPAPEGEGGGGGGGTAINKHVCLSVYLSLGICHLYLRRISGSAKYSRIRLQFVSIIQAGKAALCIPVVHSTSASHTSGILLVTRNHFHAFLSLRFGIHPIENGFEKYLALNIS